MYIYIYINLDVSVLGGSLQVDKVVREKNAKVSLPIMTSFSC